MEYGALIEPTIPNVANRISRGLFYKLLKAGTGPRIMKAGGRTLISAEAERNWHRELEAKSPK